MVLFFLFAPLLSSPLGLLGGAPSPNSILHAFLGPTSSHPHSTIFPSACCISSLTSSFKLIPPPPTHTHSSLTSSNPFLFSSPAFCLLVPSCCAFSAGSDMQLLAFPYLSLLLWAVCFTQTEQHWGWEGSRLGEGYHFTPISFYPFPIPLSSFPNPSLYFLSLPLQCPFLSSWHPSLSSFSSFLPQFPPYPPDIMDLVNISRSTSS